MIHVLHHTLYIYVRYSAMFKIRDTLCAFNRTRWNEEKALFNCSSSTNVYHCIVDERNRSGEICIQPVWVQRGYCPEYNNDANTVDTVPCEWSFGCPNGAFQSNDVYQYPVCLNKTYYDNTVYDTLPTSLPWNIIGVTVGVVVLFVVLIVVAFLCCRKRRTKQTSTQDEDQIPLLSRDIPFYKTSKFHEANDFLKSGGKFLCLTGQCGSGKSKTAKQLYLSITGRTPIVIEDILKFDVSCCQESVILEEPLPREEMSDIEKINVTEKVISLCKQIQKTNKTFLIITSTEEAWKTIADEVNSCMVQKTDLQCINLNWKDLTNVDRIQILHSTFLFYNPDTPFSNVEKNVSKFNPNNVGFPEICTLFSRCGEFQKSGLIFFNRPLRYLSLHLERMNQSIKEKEKFLVLVYMSVNDMKLDMSNSNNTLWEIFRSCGLNTKNVDLKSIIPEEFVVKEEASVYVLQHEIIKRMTLLTFGKFHFSDLLRFSSRKDLEGLIQQKETFLARAVKEPAEMQPILKVNDEQWNEYQEKIRMTAKPISKLSNA